MAAAERSSREAAVAERAALEAAAYSAEEPAAQAAKATKPRKGRSCRLPICKAAFSTVVSAPAVHAAHAGALEAGGG